MARIILTHNGAIVKEYPLTKEKLTVGRKPSNDVQLDDPTVSGTHAAFLMLQHVYIEDLDSTNGVLLNGKKVSKRQLNHGDVVRIGRHEFKYIDDNAEDFESTVIISADTPTASRPTAAQSAESHKNYVVKILSGSKAGEVLTLTKPYTTLGTPGSQMAVIARRGQNYFLMRMSGSGVASQPPRINGQPLQTESQQLNSGDTIEVSDTRMRFEEA
ncbi:FHA domain-containing protein [Thiohalophilus thiocyanatoxydans]|uniref:FHA domain-containing protein n=1 Tax=Thiohalophilus thiocyanatoxydans TaxID=381308 RepID=A0A4R8ILI7_9GAMM|nr:FHA domain-containing protein [Thiohalophilus thiocyanatoxydans]TDY01662.1 FHA domain-containing protein [Thiohalophilus thiocyanatoxydans]